MLDGVLITMINKYNNNNVFYLIYYLTLFHNLVNDYTSANSLFICVSIVFDLIYSGLITDAFE